MDANRLFQFILIAAILVVMGTGAAFMAVGADVSHIPTVDVQPHQAANGMIT